MATLSLYYYPSCGFCSMVRNTADKEGVSLELRNIHEDRSYLQELVGARGRQTVPVLRIEEADGSVQWMPESRDIMAYLKSIS